MNSPTKLQLAPASPASAARSLTSDEHKALMRSEFSARSRFQQHFKCDSTDLDCSPFGQALREEVIRQLGLKGVTVPEGKFETLHHHLSQELKDYNFDDGVNKVSTYLYDTDPAFGKLYHRFIKECLSTHFKYPFYFQATPTIRIHCPKAKNSNHYPRYHSDVCYGHPPQEVNIWIPLTDPIQPQYHSLRIMDVKNSSRVLEQYDFDLNAFVDRAIKDKPYNNSLNSVAPQVTTPLGKLFAFDSRSIHTVEPLEHHTRASMDIRIIAVEDFEKLPIEYQGTGRRKMRYVPGQGYYQLSSTEL